MFKRKEPPSGETAQPIQAVERITSVLGAGVIWHGSINGSGGVRIEVAFEGEIALRGMLVIGDAVITDNNVSNTGGRAIGTAYGVGDGSATFNLPNLQGRVPVGLDPATAGFDALNNQGGEAAHTLTLNQLPGHAHSGTVDVNLNLLKAVELALTGGKDLLPFLDPITGKDL